jgi:hypothetical protein
MTDRAWLDLNASLRNHRVFTPKTSADEKSSIRCLNLEVQASKCKFGEEILELHWSGLTSSSNGESLVSVYRELVLSSHLQGLYRLMKTILYLRYRSRRSDYQFNSKQRAVLDPPRYSTAIFEQLFLDSRTRVTCLVDLIRLLNE